MTQQNSYNIIRIVCLFSAMVIFLMYFLMQKQKVLVTSQSLHVWYTPEGKIPRPLHFNRDHGFCSYCPYGKQVSRAWQLIDIVTLLSRQRFLF